MKIESQKSRIYTEKEIVQTLKNIETIKPIIFEVSGTPNSGKTVALKRLETMLNRYGVDSVKINARKDFYRSAPT